MIDSYFRLVRFILREHLNKCTSRRKYRQTHMHHMSSSSQIWASPMFILKSWVLTESFAAALLFLEGLEPCCDWVKLLEDRHWLVLDHKHLSNPFQRYYRELHHSGSNSPVLRLYNTQPTVGIRHGTSVLEHPYWEHFSMKII